MRLKLTPLLVINLFFVTYSMSASAEDCSVKLSAKEQTRCLERKIVKLEKVIETLSKQSRLLPKNTIVELDATQCPLGWTKYQSHQNNISSRSVAPTTIKCKKN
ncbi:hypothetical protein [Pseudoalteromonas sp. MMG024]|uniref:hypothetical protein n=1 Tax=Pseudoalteromonas sp. MMG024 TaxID=2909980 RepID=UPI001F3EC8DC|nr:hypothetical protein [Pseudoalteromonas sp. MMG024]MCF6455621.1 hypothetical protein [Pseudoalteromonas sp. MMG024]